MGFTIIPGIVAVRKCLVVGGDGGRLYGPQTWRPAVLYTHPHRHQRVITRVWCASKPQFIGGWFSGPQGLSRLLKHGRSTLPDDLEDDPGWAMGQHLCWSLNGVR
jgi:hypothetical protein